jgi:hypothetical protein
MMYQGAGARQHSCRMKAFRMPVTLAQNLIEAQAILAASTGSVGFISQS